jgi:integrase
MATSARPRILASGKVSWRVQFRVEGKVTSESFTDEKEATKFARLVDRVGGEAAIRTRNARDTADRTTPTLAEWTHTYLDPMGGHLSGVTEGTRAGYRAEAERSFLQVLGEMPLDAIRRQEVTRWVAWQEAQPSSRNPSASVSAKTVRNYHALLSAVLASAANEQLITGNPARGVKLMRGIASEATFLTVDEFEQLRLKMPTYYQPLATWLVWTGMRWGEATALTWADISTDVYPPTARVTRAWKKGPEKTPVLGPPKTKKSVRTIVVQDWLVQQLGERGRPDDLVFTGMRSGGPIWHSRFYKSAWAPAVKAADLGKPVRIHDLRHTHASWLIADGVPAITIQYRLGHESITTTFDRYGHLMPDAQMAVTNSLDSRYVSTRPIELESIAS